MNRQPLNATAPWTDDTVSAIFVPVQTGGDRIGVLSVQTTRPQAYDESDVVLLEAIGRYLAIAIRNQRLFTRLQRVAEVDPLTGLANHSTALRMTDERLSSLRRTLGIVMLDVTNFGRINDVYGARVGDRGSPSDLHRSPTGTPSSAASAGRFRHRRRARGSRRDRAAR